jgi:hypothetical protein
VKWNGVTRWTVKVSATPYDLSVRLRHSLSFSLNSCLEFRELYSPNSLQTAQACIIMLLYAGRWVVAAH